MATRKTDHRVRLDHSLTVGELKKLLEDIPNDAVVRADGCDCVEDAHGIDYEAAPRRELTVIR